MNFSGRQDVRTIQDILYNICYENGLIFKTLDTSVSSLQTDGLDNEKTLKGHLIEFLAIANRGMPQGQR